MESTETSHNRFLLELHWPQSKNYNSLFILAITSTEGFPSR